MTRRRLHPILPRVALVVTTVVLLALVVPSTGAFAASAGRQGSADDCQLAAYPPTDYFGIIIPLAEVRCGSTQSRIHVEATLVRDGSAVAFAERDCHRASSCILSVDASYEDSAGNQVWCTDATGRVRSQSLGRGVACEDRDF